MIAADENALICDLAETYGIFDYKALPVHLVATLSSGLRDDSRSKMNMSGANMTTEQLLLAGIADGTNLLAWLQSKDGAKGRNRPHSILKEILKETEGGGNAVFATGEDFDSAWKRATGKEG